MSGIKVPQYDLFKIGTEELKYCDWDLTITKDEAFKYEEIVSLFQGQEFRLIAQILGKPPEEIDFSNYLAIIKIDHPKDFDKAVDPRGIRINGNLFRRFVGTTGGLKNNTLLFANVEILAELNKRCECGRNEIEIVPAKLEAYKALTCSASQPICDPQGILVVSDCLTNIIADVIDIDDSGDGVEPEVRLHKDCELENTVSDGFNICTIEYMQKVAESLEIDYVPSGVCLRNAWLKGMLYPFPIVEFVEEYAKLKGEDKYIVEDIWGNKHDIRQIDMILTESSLKLWKAYKSINDYIKAYHENGYEFAVTKIAPEVLEDQRELNYQYLQSYEFTDEDIVEICTPTVNHLKNACCGDYKSTQKFLGISENSDMYSWQRALYESDYILDDPYVIDSVHRMIRKKIDGAKIGKLLVDGNYQIVSGDPFALMQHICGLEITGLLKADEIYSRYWIDKDIDEVVVFRSPMTSHNNIRKCHIPSNENTDRWYRYMKTIMIYNGFDTICQAENGMDADGDLAFTTNNSVLLKRHRRLPAIMCIQRNVPKIFPTEKDILKTDKDAMGNKVGSITNRVTSMMEVQSCFEKDSEEYKELTKRIECGQLYQQNEIDKIKGIVAKPMPDYWYNLTACRGYKNEEFLRSICVHRKPYFMTYVYPEYRTVYRDYLTSSEDICCRQFRKTIQELQAQTELTEKESEFLAAFEKRNPFGTGLCAMNRICFYIEEQFKGYTAGLKKETNFDYRTLKYSEVYSDEPLQALQNLAQSYSNSIKEYKNNLKQKTTEDKNNALGRIETMKKYYRNKAREICPNDKQRLNLILDIGYLYDGNKQFCWDCIGNLIVKRLGELEECK